MYDFFSEVQAEVQKKMMHCIFILSRHDNLVTIKIFLLVPHYGSMTAGIDIK